MGYYMIGMLSKTVAGFADLAVKKGLGQKLF
jgi:hypothetical protein